MKLALYLSCKFHSLPTPVLFCRVPTNFRISDRSQGQETGKSPLLHSSGLQTATFYNRTNHKQAKSVLQSGPEKVSHYYIIEKSYYIVLSLSMSLDLLVKLKYELSTIIVLVDIRYFMRGLLSDLMPDLQTSDMRQIL